MVPNALEYLNIELGLCVRSGIDLAPSIDVYLNNEHLVGPVDLVNAGSVDDLSATMHWVRILTQINELQKNTHLLRVSASNIKQEYKSTGDFGFQVRSIRLNGVILEHFLRPGRTCNPIHHYSYITNFLEPNDRINEIEMVNDVLTHVESGNYANYVNSPGGWYELCFTTPVYDWIVDNNFGDLHRWLILDR